MGNKINIDSEYTYGSCFPVAPNILLTARQCVFDEHLINAGGYGVSTQPFSNTLLSLILFPHCIFTQIASIVSQQPHSFLNHQVVASIENSSKKDVREKDPITKEDWKLQRDYTFVHVMQPVHHSTKFLLPRAAREGDTLVFPALRPNVARDVYLVADIKATLILAVCYHCM